MKVNVVTQYLVTTEVSTGTYYVEPLDRLGCVHLTCRCPHIGQSEFKIHQILLPKDCGRMLLDDHGGCGGGGEPRPEGLGRGVPISKIPV